MSIQNEIIELEKQIFSDDTVTSNQINQEIDNSKDKVKKLILLFLSTYKDPTKKQYNALFADISKELSGANKSIEEEIKKRLNGISSDTISEMVKIYGIGKAIADEIDSPDLAPVWGELVEPWTDSLKRQFDLANKKIQVNAKSSVALKKITDNDLFPTDKIFNTVKNSTTRIIRTESTRIRGDVGRNIAIQAGYAQFRYVAIMDDRTSKICRSMNGKIFPISEYQIGVTVPPLHYYCRSSIILLK